MIYAYFFIHWCSVMIRTGAFLITWRLHWRIVTSMCWSWATFIGLDPLTKSDPKRPVEGPDQCPTQPTAYQLEALQNIKQDRIGLEIQTHSWPHPTRHQNIIKCTVIRLSLWLPVALAAITSEIERASDFGHQNHLQSHRLQQSLRRVRQKLRDKTRQ